MTSASKNRLLILFCKINDVYIDYLYKPSKNMQLLFDVQLLNLSSFVSVFLQICSRNKVNKILIKMTE